MLRNLGSPLGLPHARRIRLGLAYDRQGASGPLPLMGANPRLIRPTCGIPNGLPDSSPTHIPPQWVPGPSSAAWKK